MAGRSRTTKQLAQRIRLDYFKKSFPLPLWTRRLSIGLVLLGMLWLGWDYLSGGHAYNAGPVSHGHQIVANNCQACHVQQGSWEIKATDQACAMCHDAPAHQAKQVFTPTCTSCHVEHRGAFQLAMTSNASCTQCHANLKVKASETTVALNIASFSTGHPELSAMRPGHAPDPGTIKLNHQIHLKSDLRGPQGSTVQLQCADCHQPAILNADRKPLSASMAPVTFEKHCMSCHPLLFDSRFTDPAPHKETGIVEQYVIAQYTAYIAKHPNAVHEPVRLNRDLPSRPIPPAPRNAAEWIAQQTEEAERLLWQKSCKECHPLTYPAPSSRPEVPKALEPVRWMKNASFDHVSHQLVSCTECHTQAAASQKTEDVLLPVIATCQKCHREGQNAAGAFCSECHVYHDWSKSKPVRNTNSISQFAR
jgi:predicted CXXCH cytochrome family protein